VAREEELLLTFGLLVAIAAMALSGATRSAAQAWPLPRALAGLTWEKIALFNVCAAYEVTECPVTMPPDPSTVRPE
jgi:hypothetical protein